MICRNYSCIWHVFRKQAAQKVPLWPIGAREYTSANTASASFDFTEIRLDECHYKITIRSKTFPEFTRVEKKEKKMRCEPPHVHYYSLNWHYHLDIQYYLVTKWTCVNYWFKTWPRTLVLLAEQIKIILFFFQRFLFWRKTNSLHWRLRCITFKLRVVILALVIPLVACYNLFNKLFVSTETFRVFDN